MQSINHKSIFSRKLLILFFSAFLIAGFFLVKIENTFATVIFSQTNHSTVNSVAHRFIFQEMGNGLTGSIMGMTVRGDFNDYDETFSINLMRYANSDYTGFESSCELYANAGSPLSNYTATDQIIQIINWSDCGGFESLNSSKYYALRIDTGTQGDFKIRGASSDVIPGYDVCWNTAGGGNPSFTCSGSLEDVVETYFVLDTTNNAPVDDTSTRIETFTYSTTTQMANVTGFWNTHASSTERLSFWQSSAMLGEESYNSVTATTSGAFNFSFFFVGLPTPYNGSTTTAPFVAPYTLHADIDEVYSDFNPFTGEGTPPQTLDATSTLVSTLTHGYVDYTTGVGLQEYPEYECSISSITGCLKNAGIWLFYPSSDSVERFKSLSDSLSGKFPFAYVYGMNTMRLELFESAQTATTTISLNFKIIPGHATSSLTLLSSSLLSNVPYANTVKTIIGFILWLMGAEYVYYRVLRSHDPNTPQ